MEELLNNLLYFLLTNAKDKPSEIETAKKELQKEIHNAIIYWRRWRQVWKWLTDILEKQADVVSKSLLDATIELLEVKEMNIKGTTGFKPEWFSKEMSDFLDKVQELYREISITMGEVKTKAEDKNIESLVDEPDLTRGQKAKSPGDLVPRAPTFFFKDKEWEKVQRQYTDPNLYVMFKLNSDYQRIQVGLCWSEPENEEQVDEVRKLTDGMEGVKVDEEWFANYGELWVSCELPVENLRDGSKAVDALVEKLVKMRNFTNKLVTFCKALGKGTFRRSRKLAK